jgi:hypothetical protein
MNIRGGFLVCTVVFLCTLAARADLSDLTINCDKKKFEDKAAPHGPAHHEEHIKTEQWGFGVTLENRSLKPLAGLDVEYIIFYKHEQLGVKGPGKKSRLQGKSSIPSLGSLAKTTFDTESVPLTSAALVGSAPGSDYYFANGAKPTTHDTMRGIWIRVYQNGKVIADYSTPTELSQSEKWDEK